MDGRLNSGEVVTEGSWRDSVFTLPNLITLVRLLLIPVYLWLLFDQHRYVGAGFLLGTLGATDWVDGQLARRMGQVSEFGKIFDPIVDRILVVTAVITVTWVGAAPIWFAVATLAREVVVSVAVLVLASLGAKRIDVLFIGKAGTFALMCAYPWFLFAYGPATWQRLFMVLAWVVGLIGLVLSWIAAYSYIGPARVAYLNGRKGRRGGPVA